jgi:NAD-dependent deacetylase
VENYHELAGSQSIAKLHGDLGTIRCANCGQQYPNELYLTMEQPDCPSCHGFLRPNVVLYGEALPSDALKKADRLMQDVELFIVLGSSLQVSPANQFPMMAKERGARLVIVNLEPTPLDSYADLVVHHSIGNVLQWTDRILSSISYNSTKLIDE